MKDVKLLTEFVEYFNSFYGVGGIYSSGRNVSLNEIVDALQKQFEKNNEYEFEGDTVDRENLRDIIFSQEEVDAMYDQKPLEVVREFNGRKYRCVGVTGDVSDVNRFLGLNAEYGFLDKVDNTYYCARLKDKGEVA